VLNRGNRRAAIFHKPADYDDFLNLIAKTLERVPMRILALCLMPNHFHMVLWPWHGTDLSSFMHLFTTAHVRRHHERYDTIGSGHIYQGRFKNFLIQSDRHLYNVLRYVEGNALRANLVPAAETWRWTSLSRRLTPNGRPYLSEWPVARPTDWCSRVNECIDPAMLQRLRGSARRGTPYGDEEWVEETVERYGLQSTVRPPGRHVAPAATVDPFVRHGLSSRTV
jgi:putative transposase